MSKRIYVADDDANILEGIKIFLQSEGYHVVGFNDGDALFAQFKNVPCDLIILDIMMPGSDGFAICTEIRKISTVPIIMLTARDSELDYATGMNLGSDDYFTKPFSTISLVMRVKAIFRRIEFEKKNFSPEKNHDFISFGNLSLDEKIKSVTINGAVIMLTPNEYSLLHYLMLHSNKPVSRDELLDQIWGFQTDIQTRAPDDTVLRLRKKIALSSAIIESVWGVGFILRLRDNNG